jgi:hypothetical protein
MFKPKHIVLLLVIILASLAYWYYWGSSRTPAGQPPLTFLTSSNLDQFKKAFNDTADRARLVLLVSPT